MEFNYDSTKQIDGLPFQLGSSRVSTMTNYCVAFKYDNGLHLCPITNIHHMRPNFDAKNPSLSESLNTETTSKKYEVTDLNDEWIDCDITNYIEQLAEDKNNEITYEYQKNRIFQKICQTLIDTPDGDEPPRNIRNSMKSVKFSKQDFLQTHFVNVAQPISQFCVCSVLLWFVFCFVKG